MHMFTRLIGWTYMSTNALEQICSFTPGVFNINNTQSRPAIISSTLNPLSLLCHFYPVFFLTFFITGLVSIFHRFSVSYPPSNFASSFIHPIHGIHLVHYCFILKVLYLSINIYIYIYIYIYVCVCVCVCDVCVRVKIYVPRSLIEDPYSASNIYCFLWFIHL